MITPTHPQECPSSSLQHCPIMGSGHGSAPVFCYNLGTDFLPRTWVSPFIFIFILLVWCLSYWQLFPSLSVTWKFEKSVSYGLHNRWVNSDLVLEHKPLSSSAWMWWPQVSQFWHNWEMHEDHLGHSLYSFSISPSLNSWSQPSFHCP